ncbi:hypothetical protein D3C81_1628770 [compost metagenome]
MFGGCRIDEAGGGAIIFVADQPLLPRAAAGVVDRKIAHHSDEIGGTAPDGAGKGTGVEFQVGIVDDVFGVAAAAGDAGGEPDEEAALLGEDLKQGGIALGRSWRSHEAPVFFCCVGYGRESISIENHFQQIYVAGCRFPE